MRLLKRLPDDDHNEFSLVDFGDDIPPYAILSHTWGSDGNEVTFKNLTEDKGMAKSKPGYRKLSFCCKQAARDKIDFFWVDTCCIDKSSSAELTESLNSMFRWYQNSTKCYVYLSDLSISSTPIQDVSQQTWTQLFQKSRWFKRGWTLQELLAPSSVNFYSKDEQWIGDKHSLLQALHSTTGIPLSALQGSPLSEFDVGERMKWTKERHTKRGEDMAYSLLGIFDIHMPLIYGEGQEKALARLRRKIDRANQSQPPLATPQIPLLAWIVPFRRDKDFIDRDSLDEACRICAEPAARAALVGLGGVGKSQIAIEYTYRTRDQSPTKWVFWVHAGTRARFEEGYRRIAEATKMDGWDDPKVHILQLVHSWLCDTSHGEWTMVVDNADDASVFFSNTSQSCAPGNSNSSVELLSDFLPQSPNGSILITSRTQTVAWKLVGNNSSIFEVKPMDTDHALALLEKKLGSDIPRDEALRLIDALDYMPLALSQAAAFINERAPRMSISKYVDDINKSDQDRARLLTKDVGDSRRDGRASNSVLTTWQISFNYIREHAPTAARLLSLMSMFDRQGIPDSLLINHYADSEFGECDFDDDIHILSSFSLVKMNVDGREFEMHRLVQFSTKKWLAFYDEEETWKAKYAIIMGASFPKGDYENWSVCRALLPHAQAIVDSRPRESQPQEAWAVVIHNLASYLCDMGQYNTSKKLSSVALQSRQSILGEEHTDTLNSLVIFGIILEYQGKYDEAEVVHKRVLGIRERTLGLDHVNTQDSMLNLANTYACQGQLHRAEEMQMQAMELRKINLGEDHPDTLISMGNLASTYLKQRRWKEAENLDVQVLVARKATLGKDHPNTLVSMSNLAMTYSDQGRWQEAENLGVQVLRGRKAKLGKNHPDTLVSMSNLAITYSDQGRWQEAENLEVQVLKARKAKLGEDHPNTLISMGNLAQTYLGQGRWQEAEKLNVQVLEARKTKLGEDHPDTLTCMGNLASTYSSQGRWKEAESLEVQVLRGRKAKLGKDHPDTLMSMSNLACTWWIRGHRDEALELMENCVQLKRRVLGVRHDHTINSMETLDDWREELADPVQTTEEREEIEGAGTTPEKIAKMSAQKPTDPVRTTKTRVVIEEAEQAPEEIAETPAQETVMKKRKSIAVRMRQDHKSGTD